MGTVVVLAILAGVVALIVRKMIKDKKNGKSIQCLDFVTMYFSPMNLA